MPHEIPDWIRTMPDPRDDLTPAQQRIYDRVLKEGKRTGGDLKPILDADPGAPADKAAVARAFAGK